MKKLMIALMVTVSTSCEVCRECERTYHDPNGTPIVTQTEEICGTNREVKQQEGIQYVNDVKTIVKCK